ncbi:hypothetical protein ACV229_10655 [Burkholderia sp. MR1-5-21]
MTAVEYASDAVLRKIISANIDAMTQRARVPARSTRPILARHDGEADRDRASRWMT